MALLLAAVPAPVTETLPKASSELHHPECPPPIIYPYPPPFNLVKLRVLA